jgi:hypothetical protein
MEADMSKTVRSKKKAAVEASAQPVEVIESRPEPTSDEIARRAYEIYLERGPASGNDVEDWLQAERELRGEK